MWRRSGGVAAAAAAAWWQRGTSSDPRVCVCCVASSFRGHGDGAAVLLGRRGELHAGLKANPVL